MSLQGLILVALAAAPSTAFFLMPCWPITTQRLDPLVSPGEISSHVHQIIGGNAFAPTLTYDDTQAEDVCTTCFVQKDHSNYWIPSLYFQNADGSFESVDQVGSTSVYYFNEAARLGPNETMTPFPEGFRMLAGDPDKRTGGTDFADQAINYKCLNYAGSPSDSKGFPNADCPDGVRAEVTFPSCWDGVNLDSDDHKSHVAYPTETYQSGECPSSHPVHLVTLLVEFIWDTHKFAGQWPNAGENPFVWSSGDPTGFGLHADFIMGWDFDLLSAAVEQCDDEFGVLANCAPFDGLLPPADEVYANPGTCTTKDYVNENVSGTLAKLPGCNPVDATGSESSQCNDDASINGTWPGEGDSSGDSSSSSGGGGYSSSWSPASGAPAGTGSGVASPVAVSTSAPAGSYGNGQSGYSSGQASQSSAGAFYAAPAAAPAAESSSSPPSPSPSSPSPLTTSTSIGIGADGRHTLTVWDIDTVTVYVTATAPAAAGTQGEWKKREAAAEPEPEPKPEPESESVEDEAAMIKREAARVLHGHRQRHGRRNGGLW